MKMIILTFRNTLEVEIRSLLEKSRVHAYTEIPKVHGIGEAGSSFGSFTSLGENSLIFLAVPKEQASQMVKVFQDLRDRLSKDQHDAKIPMKLFVLPCEQII